MTGYRFYPAADQRQDEIWRYTSEQWGEAQAEKYIHDLHNHIQELAERKRPWKPLPGSLIVPLDLDIDVFYSRYESHYLFFRELSNGVIGVMGIVHGAMDLPVRLGEDLGRIDRSYRREG